MYYLITFDSLSLHPCMVNVLYHYVTPLILKTLKRCTSPEAYVNKPARLLRVSENTDIHPASDLAALGAVGHFRAAPN
jgi:hypothetical protein